MVGVMTLSGPVVVDHFHHEHHHVFPIIGAHFLGIYALVIVVGDLVDRIGRTHALSGGLLLMGISVSCLLWVRSAHATTAALSVLGLGWNLSFVAATAELAERTESSERGSLLGFNDLPRSGSPATGPHGDAARDSQRLPEEGTMPPYLSLILAEHRTADRRLEAR
jgi:MFS family permease